MRLLVTGASSFVGAHFCRVAAREHQVLGLHHATPLRLPGVSPVRADLSRPRDLRRLQELDFDAVVHLACKIKGRAAKGQDPAEVAVDLNQRMMDAVLSLGRPIVYASSTVVHWAKDTPYGRGRREDERRVAGSGLPWAVVRPSAPYGPRLVTHQPRHRESFHTLVELVRRSPVVPVIGDGRYRRQPVHVDDLSAAILGLLTRPGGLPGQAFDAGGAQALSFDDLIDNIARALGRRVCKLHLPRAVFVQAARFSRDFDPSLLDAVEQDEVVDPSALAAASGVQPRPFSAGVRDVVR